MLGCRYLAEGWIRVPNGFPSNPPGPGGMSAWAARDWRGPKALGGRPATRSPRLIVLAAWRFQSMEDRISEPGTVLAKGHPAVAAF